MVQNFRRKLQNNKLTERKIKTKAKNQQQQTICQHRKAQQQNAVSYTGETKKVQPTKVVVVFALRTKMSSTSPAYSNNCNTLTVIEKQRLLKVVVGFVVIVIPAIAAVVQKELYKCLLQH